MIKDKDKINAMLDNMSGAINNMGNIYSRLSRIAKLMPLIKDKYDSVLKDVCHDYSIDYCDGFLDGYECRINGVWNGVDKEPGYYEQFICETELHDFFIDTTRYNEGNKLLWSEYVKNLRVIRWAYVKDLIPIKEE